MKMQIILILTMLAAITVGCARDPVTPSNIYDEPHKLKPASDADSGPYRLFGEWTFYIDESHENITVVPKRQPRFHLNALKFLESYCTDCVKPLKLKNNGDGTVDLTIMIKHPFPGMAEYTAFDVKGIIMFQGSHEIKYPSKYTKFYPLYPGPYHVSWHRLGDPELLNADGYSYRWSPSYDSGSNQPIFNYWEGKFAKGSPTANINGYKNFYTKEERHIFETDKHATATYHISLPPGPVVVGYAVEACWEPPFVTPVTNPVEDFPITANQPEAYHFKLVVNNGNPITDPTCCNVFVPYTCEDLRSERKIWYIPPEYDQLDYWWVVTWTNEFGLVQGVASGNCGPGWPDWIRKKGGIRFCKQPVGFYQMMAFQYHVFITDLNTMKPFGSFDIFEVEIQVECE